MLHPTHQGLGRFRYKAEESSRKMCGMRHVLLYGREKRRLMVVKRDACKSSGMGRRPPNGT